MEKLRIILFDFGIVIFESIILFGLYSYYSMGLLLFYSIVFLLILLNIFLFNYVSRTNSKVLPMLLSVLPIILLLIPLIPQGDITVYVQRSLYYNTLYDTLDSSAIPSFDELWLHTDNTYAILNFKEKNIIPKSDSYFLSLISEEEQGDLPYIYSFYIKNEGKKDLSDIDLYISMNFKDAHIKGKDALINNLEVSEGGFYTTQRVSARINKLDSGQITYFVVKTDTLSNPHLTCGSNIKGCDLGVDTNRIIILDSLPVSIEIRGILVEIPKPLGKATFIYSPVKQEWVAWESTFKNPLEYTLEIV